MNEHVNDQYAAYGVARYPVLPNANLFARGVGYGHHRLHRLADDAAQDQRRLRQLELRAPGMGEYFGRRKRYAPVEYTRMYGTSRTKASAVLGRHQSRSATSRKFCEARDMYGLPCVSLSTVRNGARRKAGPFSLGTRTSACPGLALLRPEQGEDEVVVAGSRACAGRGCAHLRSPSGPVASFTMVLQGLLLGRYAVSDGAGRWKISRAALADRPAAVEPVDQAPLKYGQAWTVAW